MTHDDEEEEDMLVEEDVLDPPDEEDEDEAELEPEEEEGDGEIEGDRDCVTCREVLRPFLDNPHECWTTWVPWAGVDGEGEREFAPALYERLGLQWSVEGDAVKVREGGCSAFCHFLTRRRRVGPGMHFAHYTYARVRKPTRRSQNSWRSRNFEKSSWWGMPPYVLEAPINWKGMIVYNPLY